MIELWQRAPTTKSLRSFGLLVGSVFFALGVLALVRHPHGRTWAPLLTVGGLLVLFGLARPVLLKLPYQLWMALGALLGYVSTAIVLTVTYLTVFTLVRAILRALRRDPLDISWKPGRAQTYWRERETMDMTDRHLRPF